MFVYKKPDVLLSTNKENIMGEGIGVFFFGNKASKR
jgi:hypothetical protein